MGTYNVISQDTSTTVNVTGSGDSWVLKEGVYLAVVGVGILGNDSFNYRTVRVDGHILSTGTSIYLGEDAITGGANSIIVGAYGSIDSNARGMLVDGGSNSVVNNGAITSRFEGVALTGSHNNILNSGSIYSSMGAAIGIDGYLATINNSGILMGHTGILAAGVYNSIVNSGSIIVTDGNSSDAAIIFEDGGGELLNTGLISGTFGYSIFGSNGDETINNHGTIDGYVDLGDGDDYFFTDGITSNAYVDLGAGNDTYVSVGANTMGVSGGYGNDTFIIDNNKIAIDEQVGGGLDRVMSSVNYRLGQNLENLWLSGDDDIRGAGNKLDNFLSGNSGDNRLFGRGGNDTFDGGDGGDIIRGGKGNDTVVYLSSDQGVVVSLALGKGYEGSAEDDRLINIENLMGSLFDDQLTGNGKANRLDGRLGDDTLRGGGGKDVFVFYAYGNAPNKDVILDFANGVDRIETSNLGSNFDTFAELQAISKQVGNDVVIEISAGHSMTIKNFALSSLDASDFIFG